MGSPRLPVAPPGQWERPLEDSDSRSLRPQRLVLTTTDLELFRWLWMLRVMTLDQLRRVAYYQPNTGRLSSLHNVRKRLRRLWKEDYLVGDTLLETRERIYFLAERALPPLREHCGIAQRRLYKPKGSETMRQLLHPLMVSECAVRVHESVRNSPLQLLDLAPLWIPFIHTHAVGDASKKKHVERFVSQEDIRAPGSARLLRIRPDLVFALAKGDVGRLYFLEADRGHESPQEIALKQHGYRQYMRATDPIDPQKLRWHRYGPLRDFRVLLVTTNRQRVKSLYQYLHDRPGFDLMALASIDAVREKNMAYDGVWTNREGADRALARRTKD